MTSGHRLLSELITEARTDEVGLWLIIASLRDETGITDPMQLREATLDFVRKFLDSGDVVAGYYRPDGSGVSIWDMSTDDVVARIRQEWDRLGREPNIGEIVTFVGRPEV